MMRNRFGRIVNIGSVTGFVGDAGQANYAAARAGLVGLTKTLARELGAKGITANMVAPGYLETSRLEQFPPQRLDELIKAVPLRRLGRPEEIAHAVSFVTSDLAGYMTGRVLVIDGGLAA
jgi:3-oxoacyl-[acyl-carrier protein] reductase